jgi:hypothetical protein
MSKRKTDSERLRDALEITKARNEENTALRKRIRELQTRTDKDLREGFEFLRAQIATYDQLIKSAGERTKKRRVRSWATRTTTLSRR